MARLLKVVAGIGVGAILVSWLLQPLEQRLMFFPSRVLNASPADYGLEFERVALTAADNVNIMGWAVPSTSDTWVIYFHGNGNNIGGYLPFTTRLHAYGINVFNLEYRGYGESEGEPSETGIYLDADAAYDYLIEQGVPPENIVLYGFSLGSGVATDLASRRPVGAVVLEAPYTSIGDVARALYRIVPTVLIRNRFASIEKIENVHAPLLILHSQRDLTVPYVLGRELFEAANEPKEFLEIRGGHADLMVNPSREVVEHIVRFIENR